MFPGVFVEAFYSKYHVLSDIVVIVRKYAAAFH